MTYLMVVWIVNVQNTHERAPKRSSLLNSPALLTMAFIVYRGLVPISPYTIPRVTRSPANESFLMSICLSVVVMAVILFLRLFLNEADRNYIFSR
jgi:hypothetical protein